MGASAQSFRLLLVDDEPDLRQLMNDMLANLPVECSFAADGKEAQEILSADDNIDLVITDLTMPRVTGEELVAWVKLHAPKTKSIIVTGNPTLESAINALRVGAYDYIVKPLHRALFVQTVQNALDLIALEKDKKSKLAEISHLYEQLMNQKLDLGFTQFAMEETVISPLRAVEARLEPLVGDETVPNTARAELATALIELARARESMAICLKDTLGQN